MVWPEVLYAKQAEELARQREIEQQPTKAQFNIASPLPIYPTEQFQITPLFYITLALFFISLIFMIISITLISRTCDELMAVIKAS